MTLLAQLYFTGRTSTSCSISGPEWGGPGCSAELNRINDLHNTFSLKSSNFPLINHVVVRAVQSLYLKVAPSFLSEQSKNPPWTLQQHILLPAVFWRCHPQAFTPSHKCL